MSGLSKVVVVQSDRRAVQAIRLGFEREGAQVIIAKSPEEAAKAVTPDVGLVVAGASSSDSACSLLGQLSEARAEVGTQVPFLYVGNGATRREAIDAGADEVLTQPAFVRDVVTVGKLLASTKPGARTISQGDLGDTFGVFYLVRAVAATGRSAVLSMVRGLRRGEVRFFEGEVTSASVGGLHGQAALHQLLLWTEARFELRWEEVVRRRQIPLEREELLRDAERFLTDIREVAGGLSPAAVYEQDPARLSTMSRQIPTEVHGVLRLFDGHRTIADVLEDSPYRVFETLRVAQRAAEVGLIQRVHMARPKGANRAVLAVEEWLVGNDPPAAPSARVQPVESGSTSTSKKHRHKNKHKKRKSTLHGVGVVGKAGQVTVVTAKPVPTEIDWGALVPRADGLEISGLSGVVPSSATSGEIVVHEIDESQDRTEAMRQVDLDADAIPEPTPESDGHAFDTTLQALAEVGDAAPRPQDAYGAQVTVPVDAAAMEAAAKASVASDEDEDEDELSAVMRAAAERGARAASKVAEDRERDEADRIARELAALEERQRAITERMERPRPSTDSGHESSGEINIAPPSARTTRPVDDGPSILIDDIAAAQAAISLVTEKVRTRRPAPDASSVPQATDIDVTRSAAMAAALAATHFTADEEAFFSAGANFASAAPDGPVDTFADLDEGYRHVGFWERVFGWLRRKKRPLVPQPVARAPLKSSPRK